MPEDTSQPVAVETPADVQPSKPKKPPAKKAPPKPKSETPNETGGMNDNAPPPEKIEDTPAVPAPKKTVVKKSAPKPVADETSKPPVKDSETDPVEKAEPVATTEVQKEPPKPKPKAKTVAKKPPEVAKPEAAPNDDMKVTCHILSLNPGDPYINDYEERFAHNTMLHGSVFRSRRNGTLKGENYFPFANLTFRRFGRMDQLLMLWRSIQDSEENHIQHIAEIENRLKLAESEIIRLGMYCGEYQLLWKIRDFRRVYEDATSETKTAIQSPAFDTHRNGYKMQLSMCPNGDGRGKGQAMSVFFTILKGPYDNILKWPFLCPVKIALIDQQGTGGERTGQPPRDVFRTFMPNPRPENEPFLGRPTTERNMSLGFPRFVHLTELFSGGYIQEESVYIKVFVDISAVVNNLVVAD